MVEILVMMLKKTLNRPKPFLNASQLRYLLKTITNLSESLILREESSDRARNLFEIFEGLVPFCSKLPLKNLEMNKFNNILKTTDK